MNSWDMEEVKGMTDRLDGSQHIFGWVLIGMGALRGGG